YKEHAQQGSGGSLCMLYHLQVGPLFAASMAKYLLVEANNQQPNPNNEDVVLTPRLEAFDGQEWYTNLYDLQATVSATDQQGIIQLDVQTQLVNESRMAPKGKPREFQLSYQFEKDKVSIGAKRLGQTDSPLATHLILPIISPSGEPFRQDQPSRIQVHKPQGTVTIEANSPIGILPTAQERGFNMVPGLEALPLAIKLSDTPNTETICSITVHS
ncbi:MAG: hypothetical protein AAF804_19505, partial [Bacteroidota bacterium]